MTPVGVATYDNVKIQKYLPTAEQIQQQIEIAEEEYKLTLQLDIKKVHKLCVKFPFQIGGLVAIIKITK